MNAGQLNQIIEIYEPQIIKNEVGEEVEEWVNKLHTKAYVRHLNGSRNIENDEVVYNYTVSFTVRYYIKVDDYDRIKYNNKFYRILNIAPDMIDQSITITTELINE